MPVTTRAQARAKAAATPGAKAGVHTQAVTSSLAKFNADWKYEPVGNRNFKALSNEILLMIFKLTLPTGETYDEISVPPLCQVNRFLREHASPFFFSRNSFDLSYQDYMRDEEDSNIEIYESDFSEMGEVFAFHIPYMRNITIYSKETFLEGSANGWLGIRPMDYVYKLTLAHKNSRLVKDCKDGLIERDDLGMKGEAVVDSEDLDWSDPEHITKAFASSVDTTWEMSGSNFAAHNYTGCYPAIEEALQELGPYINEDYFWVFTHDGMWEPSDHEWSLIDRRELEREKEREERREERRLGRVRERNQNKKIKMRERNEIKRKAKKEMKKRRKAKLARGEELTQDDEWLGSDEEDTTWDTDNSDYDTEGEEEDEDDDEDDDEEEDSWGRRW